MLQWGRRPKTAEITKRRRGAFRTCTVGLHASMGPPSEDGGNLIAGIAAAPWSQAASMGPPSEDGGNAATRALSGFGNGAAGLQWGRRPKTAEMRIRMPPARCAWQGFNGAAVRRRRKSWPEPVNSGPSAGRASMGPPSEDGGNRSFSAPRLADRRKPTGFNGAAVRRRRKSSAKLGSPSIRAPTELQWGRRPKTAEISDQSTQGLVAATECAQLQWGRRPKTAEMLGDCAAPALTRGCHEDVLQWGRRPKTAEIGSCAPRRA
jgi:hypothetical protein